MHCPRCGQQQISDETKFCSRCGFQLGLIGEILQNNGTHPLLADLYNKNQGMFTRRNGVLFSLFWFLFFLFIMTPVWAIADVEELAGISAILGIFGGLILMIGSLVFLKRPSAMPPYMNESLKQPATAGLYSNPAQQHALPPQQSQPAESYMAPQGGWRTPDTGEFAVPGSVTETTTKLLKKNE